MNSISFSDRSIPAQSLFLHWNFCIGLDPGLTLNYPISLKQSLYLCDGVNQSPVTIACSWLGSLPILGSIFEGFRLFCAHGNLESQRCQ